MAFGNRSWGEGVQVARSTALSPFLTWSYIIDEAAVFGNHSERQAESVTNQLDSCFGNKRPFFDL